MKRSLFVALTALIGLSAGAANAAGEAAPAAEHGGKVYQRCAACHLPTGAGVPGAFPRLAGRINQAATGDGGRDYLVMVVSKGLVGEIEIDGRKYRGVMPAQAGLTDEDIAAVLNYAMALKTPGEAAPAAAMEPAKPFTKEEVAEIRARHAEANPGLVHSFRAGVFDVPLPEKPAADSAVSPSSESNK
ncbi:MAG: cytochrome c [Parvularculaceae bacterium]